MWSKIPTILASAILFVSFGTSTASTAPEGFSISSRILRWQKSCPAQILALNSAKAGWFINDVLVLNAGETDIQEIEVGLVLSEASKGTSPPRGLKEFTGYRIAAAIAPGKAAAIGPQLWTVGSIKKELRGFGKGDYLFTVGVTSVLFADGRRLAFNPDTDFVEGEMPGIDEVYQHVEWAVVDGFAKTAQARAAKMYERSKDVYQKSPRAVTPLTENGNGGYFKCEDTGQPVFCTNNVSSCTTTECAAGKPCPNQKCEYYY